MDVKRCENGHFYDADKNKICPRCVIEKKRNAGKEGTDSNSIEQRTKALNADFVSMPEEKKRKRRMDMENQENRTVGFYSMKMEREPVVGWLVCTKGEEEGMSFPLKLGRNFIGRGSDMDVVLKNDKAVSRKKHAIVLYEPRTKSFIAQPGESRELVYLNDKVVLASERLKPYDVLAVGNSELSFVPFCGPNFVWEDWDETE